ncbi:hypothetical protein ACFLQL_01760 [Verrucomicrobiota bacterium]
MLMAIHALVVISILLVVNPVSSEEKRSSALEELRQKADTILKQPNVSARKDIDVVFELVDLLIRENQPEEAEKYVVKGLQHFPWNLKYQIIYADLLAKSGEQKKAGEKAKLVWQYAETDELINRAGKLLNKKPLPQFEKISKLPDTTPCVVLVPFQNCDKYLIVRIKDELAAKLKIPVFIREIDTEYPAFSRDRREAIINNMRKRFIKKIKDAPIVKAMKKLNLTEKDLDKEDNVIKLAKYLLRGSEAGTIAEFDAYFEGSRGKAPQWHADQLQDTLFRIVRPYRRKNVAYLAITPVDIYARDYNFLFGSANTAGGVMSYRRFTADYNDDIPNQDRLIKRTLMQCLASVGHIYDIDRCTNPTCARAYPNSLSEHDAKKETLCSQCKDGFKTKFKQQAEPEADSPVR